MRRIALVIFVFLSFSAFSQSTNEKAEMIAAVKYLNKWGYINSSGKEIISPRFDGVYHFKENGYAIVWLKKKAGLVDFNGRVVIEPKYDEISNWHNDGYAQIILNGKKGIVELESGKVVIPAIYEDMNYYDKENLNRGGLAVKLNGKWGIIDKSNKTIIEFKYDSLGNYEKDYIPFLKEGKWGYLKPTGLVAFPPQFESAKEFVKGKAIVIARTKYTMIDKEKQLDLDYNFIMKRYDGYYLTWGWNKKMGLLNKDGIEIAAPQYDDISIFSEGWARFKINGKFGFMDEKGVEVIKAIYDGASEKKVDGSIWTILNKKYGLLYNVSTAVVPTYDYVTPFSEGYAWVYLNQKWGLIDRYGNQKVDFKYDNVNFVKEGRAVVYKGNKAGYIDLGGNEKTPLKYDSAGAFKQGLGIVYLDGKAGFVDKDGAEVIPPRYENASNFYPEGMAWIERNKKYGLIDWSGQEILPTKYDAAFNFFNGVSFVKSDSKYGIVNDKGKLISPIKYDSIAQWIELKKTGLKETFTDNRDGKTYKTIKIGNQWVMAENFAYKPPFGTVWVYDNDLKNLAANAYLYDWTMAKLVVPVGWHIPTKLEWKTLLNSLELEEDDPADILVEGGISGFSAIMSGARNNEAIFELKGMGTAFWSATDPMPDKAYIFVLVFDEGKYTYHLDLNYKTFGHSLRLFKD